MNNIQDNIINKIKSGEMEMKPRWHFVLKSLLLILGLLLVALIGIYLLSFVMFTLRQSGIGFIPLYGFRGISQFVVSSPWLIIAFAGAFIGLLQILVSKYSFSYRRPLLYSMIGVVLLVLVGSFIIEQTMMHQRIQQLSEQHHLPVFAPMYRGIQENRPDNIIFGNITKITETGFVILSDKEERLEIIITGDTKQKPGAVYEVDQPISVFGDREGEKVTAIGIRPDQRGLGNLQRYDTGPERGQSGALHNSRPESGFLRN